MPPRSTPPPKGSFCPPNDNATYRDLLLFEERLKTNAASLQRRKSRYQGALYTCHCRLRFLTMSFSVYLFQLLVVIVFLLSEVLLPPSSSLLAIPYNWTLQRLLPNMYGPDTHVTLHPFFASGLLLVSVTTLVLFFASGMYSEKIAYANKWVISHFRSVMQMLTAHRFRYVPHANRALRSFNMYLNVRKPPLRSKFNFNPLAFFFPRPEETASSTSSSLRSPSPTSSRVPEASTSRSRSSSTSLPIPSIPPAVNPRGELIFSSRVDRSFRDSYERYRAAFERRREERERIEQGKSWWRQPFFWKKPAAPPAGLTASTPIRTVSGSSTRSKGGSRSNTPPTKFGGGSPGPIMIKQRDRGDSPMRSEVSSETPPQYQQRSRNLPSTGISRQGSTHRGRRDGGEGDMRTMALERSLGQGSPQ